MKSSKLKKMTYGCGQAIKVLVAQKLDHSVTNSEVAKKHLKGETIHPIDFAELEKEATVFHNRLARDVEAVKQANVISNQLAVDYGYAA